MFLFSFRHILVIYKFLIVDIFTFFVGHSRRSAGLADAVEHIVGIAALFGSCDLLDGRHFPQRVLGLLVVS